MASAKMTGAGSGRTGSGKSESGDSGRLSRRRFLATLGGAAAGLALHGCGGGSGAPPGLWPNIVLIVADDLGYGDLGVYGCPDIATPNLDSLARDGVQFSSGYVSCPLCSPTRAGLLTGRYQQRFGHEYNPVPGLPDDPRFGLPQSETTLAERLRALGYATGLVGKWHLGYQEGMRPLDRGFQEFFGFLNGLRSYLPGGAIEPGGELLNGTRPVQLTEYLPDALGRVALSFINRHRRAPFFLMLCFKAVHAPLEATQPYLDRVAHIADDSRRTMAAILTAMDDNVGRVLARLQAYGLDARTLVVFVSDNGGDTPWNASMNSPLRGYKSEMWEGGIRVPFLLRWPGQVPAGMVYDEPVSSLDVVPTVMAAAGQDIAPEWGLDGVDLRPYLTGEASGPPHEALYWRMGEQSAIRQGEWKLVVEGAGPRLFNLAEDIGESNDLAALMPDKVAELQALWEAWSAQMAPPRWVW